VRQYAQLILTLGLLAQGGPVQARLSPAFERTLRATVRQYNRQVRGGQQPMDLGLVFRLVGRTLERTGGDERKARQMAHRAARWSAGRPGPRPATALSPAVSRALGLACHLHRDQLRKGTTVPYVAHLLGVAGIVMRSGGTEREIVAALLHDAVEDQGGARTLALIRHRFGAQVARIVNEVSEPPGPWLQRKQDKIERIAGGRLSAAALRVKLADSLHNSGTMTKGARRQGDAFWDVFRGKRAGTLWYYDAMTAAFSTATKGSPGLRRMSRRLESQVDRLHRAADQGGNTRAPRD
jgi:hypothetical protein